jgi:hypothetical protein
VRRLGVIAALALAFAGCGSDSVSGTSEEIADAVHRAGTSDEPFRLAEATGFDWDRAYVFGPYTSPRRIREQLGFDWDGADDTAVETADWVALLVFLRDGEVVEAYDQEVTGGDFTDLPRLEGEGLSLTPEEAVLRVRRFREGGETFEIVHRAETG